MSAPVFSYAAEMGFSHRELHSRLPSAVAPYRVSQLSPTALRFSHDAYWVEMLLQAETVRRIASIALPVTGIELNFYQMPETEYQRFLHRFKRYLHKGGG